MHRSCGGFAVCASGGGGWLAVHYELWATVWVGRFVRKAGATSESWNRYLKHYTTLSYINVLATCSRWLSYTTLDTHVWRFLWAREVVVHHFDEQPAMRLIWPERYNLFFCVMVVYSTRRRGGRGLAYILYVRVREQVHLTQCRDFLVTEARATSKLWNWLFKHHTTPFWATCIS